MVTLTETEGKECIVSHIGRKILNNIPVWELCCSVTFDRVYSFFVESTGYSGETEQTNVSVNGVAHSVLESASETKSTDVSRTPAEEQGKLICNWKVLL
jgi:hypothetical protein